MVQMPRMYKAVFDAFESDEVSTEIFAVYLFLEYVAEKRTSVFHTKEHDEFCKAVESGSWNRYNRWPSKESFCYLSKILVYYIVRSDRGFEIENIFGKGSLLSKYMSAFQSSLIELHSQLPFDDTERCSEIYHVMNWYMPQFEEEYAHRD